MRQRRQIVYRWQYLALAVDSVRGQMYWAWLDNVKKETVAELVKGWKERGITALVWDGSGGHRARLVREAGVKLIGLPPYAPELNPAERVFQEIRGRTEGRLYENLEAKRAAAIPSCRNWQAIPGRCANWPA
ncbi:MAG: transposase [Bacteroidetes bacterium]|nr:transposase [Bacteroidota bacterium]